MIIKPYEIKETLQCYYYAKFIDELFFTYCKNCKRANNNENPSKFIPTITTDLNDNQHCISFVEA